MVMENTAFLNEIYLHHSTEEEKVKGIRITFISIIIILIKVLMRMVLDNAENSDSQLGFRRNMNTRGVLFGINVILQRNKDMTHLNFTESKK